MLLSASVCVQDTLEFRHLLARDPFRSVALMANAKIGWRRPWRASTNPENNGVRDIDHIRS
ncbi:MAG: hypothetical protein KC561_20655 [Myxococcales bacterium]|nr:hypothetical protein [Myxococcales bacterium]